jgi:hypothetical protein
MNPKVEAYIAAQELEEQKKIRAYREKILQITGLATKEYAPEQGDSADYPLFDDEKFQSFRWVYEEVTDEEFEKLETYAKKQAEETPEKDKLFTNIGAKLCTVGKIVGWLGIVVSVLGGIVFLAQSSDLLPVGLLVAVVGSLTSWFTGMCIYGFGHLIKKVDRIAG